MSKIKIDTIQTKSKFCSLSETEASVIVGGKIKFGDINIAIAVAPTITINNQLAGSLGGDAFNMASLNTGSFIMLAQQS